MADLLASLQAAAGAAGAEETDPNFNQTVLLLHGDGTNGAQNNTFLDSSSNGFSITRNGNTTQGTFSPFSAPDGRWSNYFDGTDDYLSVADNAVLRPGAGAFTLEAWVYRNAAGAAHTIYAKGGASTGINFQITSGNVLRFTHTTTNIDSTGTVAANAWVHVAVVREGTGANQTKLYINGTQDGQGTVSTDFTQTEEVRIGTNRSAGDDFAGYISNVRFVKGSALYTGNFTPSTSPLTTTSQGAVSSEVELLTCQSNRFVDNSTNGFTVTPVNNVKVTPFSPFAPTAAYDASVNGGSGYFDGTGDYLVIPYNLAFSLTSGDFTVELWVYKTAHKLSTNIGIGGSAWRINGNANGTISWTANGSIRITSSIIPLYEWNHIAAVKSGSTTTLYVNSVAVGTTISSPSATTSNLIIGTNGGALNTWTYPGYMAGVRVLKGTAIDFSSTGIPTAPPTDITNTSILCNFTNAGIFDNTGKNNLETVADAQIDTTTKKFGTGSMEFDGTGDYLTFPITPEYTISASENFTVECWFYRTSAAALVDLFSLNSAATGYAAVQIQATASSTITLNVSQTGSAWAINSTSATTHNLNEWNHLAVVRSSGNTFNVYLNGTSIIGPTTNANALYSAGAYNIIGGRTGGAYFVGLIDDFRYTKGVARYTTAFTPPTKAFPNL